MPATFESFGLKFLYPDNWQVVLRDEDDAEQGVTLEMPSGGFFSLERNRDGSLDDELIEEVANMLAEEYSELEREDVPGEEGERIVDFRFYYLDLVIVSRLILMNIGADRYLVQFQTESRDFDENQPVLGAILKQIREAV